VTLDVACPSCGEDDDLAGRPVGGGVELTCGSCGSVWNRSGHAACERCGGTDLQTVPLAIVERSRGTQLSVVGTRPVTLCSSCDRDTLRSYHDHRPNPLMPDELPTRGEEQMNG
jgi:hypothetical protein